MSYYIKKPERAVKHNADGSTSVFVPLYEFKESMQSMEKTCWEVLAKLVKEEAERGNSDG